VFELELEFVLLLLFEFELVFVLELEFVLVFVFVFGGSGSGHCPQSCGVLEHVSPIPESQILFPIQVFVFAILQSNRHEEHSFNVQELSPQVGLKFDGGELTVKSNVVTAIGVNSAVCSAFFPFT